jgi:glycosyltransferase involved in cell wall biosynthesis
MNCRLLYLVGELRPGGSERQLYFLLERMDRDRYKPAVAVWNFREDATYVDPIRRLRVPLHWFSGIASAPQKLNRFRRLVRELKPEIINSVSFYLNFAAHFAALGTQSIAIGSVRGNFAFDKSDVGPWLGSLNGRWPRNQICNSFSALEAAQRSPRFLVPRRLAVIRNGLNLEDFSMTPMSMQEPVCIAGVGSLLPVKRWDRLLYAAAELKNRGANFVVRIAGDGPLREFLEHRSQDLGVSKFVEILGHVEDVPRLLSQAAFLVHVSDAEGCPNAVMEAMACGRAVVATNVGDVASLVEDRKTGFVVARQDHAALVERIADLVKDLNLCCRMGVAARAKAEREFRSDRLLSETFSAYREAGWRDF